MNIDFSIQIIPYDGQSRDNFISLFREYTYGRYCSDWTLDLEASRRLELDRLFSYIQQNPANCWLATGENGIVGLLGLHLSKWDTDFWGIKYANIDHLITIGPEDDFSKMVMKKLVQKADKWCQSEQIDFVVARADVLDLVTVQTLEEHGFKYIETTITNTLDIKHLDPVSSKDYVIRLARPEETDLLVDFSLDAFPTHRFYAEKRFSTAKVDEMYRQWVRNALTNISVWTTVVLEKDSKVLGFMTYAIEDVSPYFGMSFIKLRMACLDKKERGKSHGVDLFNGVVKFVHSQGDVIVSGLTIRNIHSFNLHTKLNYKLKCSSNTFHKWYS